MNCNVRKFSNWKYFVQKQQSANLQLVVWSRIVPIRNVAFKRQFLFLYILKLHSPISSNNFENFRNIIRHMYKTLPQIPGYEKMLL